MTYQEYLVKNFKPDREDVGFIVSMVTVVLTIMLLIAVPLSFGYGNLDPIWAALTILIVTFGGVFIVGFVGTFVYWMIVKR